MAAPSEVPGASDLAAKCVARHRANTGEDLSELLDNKDPLGTVASHFFAKRRLEDYFIPALIEWLPFHKRWNQGHEAVADLLLCEVIDTVVTTNIDQLVEQAARYLGAADFRCARDGKEANLQDVLPYLKVHGCCHLDKRITLWCQEQLQTETWKQPLEASRAWLAGRLLEKDLVLIGFWTDWAYLLEALSFCLDATSPRKLIIVNRDDEEALKQKAPRLWEWVRSVGVEFELVSSVSGEKFLECLRGAYSTIFLQKLLDKGRSQFLEARAETEIPTINFDGLDHKVVYDLRRDWTGAPRDSAVTQGRVDDSWTRTAHFILEILARGGQFENEILNIGGKRYRVVHAVGQYLSQIKYRYRDEPPEPTAPPIMVAVGAIDDGNVPSHITRQDTRPSIVRSGMGGEWVTDVYLLESLSEHS